MYHMPAGSSHGKELRLYHGEGRRVRSKRKAQARDWWISGTREAKKNRRSKVKKRMTSRYMGWRSVIRELKKREGEHVRRLGNTTDSWVLEILREISSGVCIKWTYNGTITSISFHIFHLHNHSNCCGSWCWGLALRVSSGPYQTDKNPFECQNENKVITVVAID